MLGFPLCQAESSFVCILGLQDCTVHKGSQRHAQGTVTLVLTRFSSELQWQGRRHHTSTPAFTSEQSRMYQETHTVHHRKLSHPRPSTSPITNYHTEHLGKLKQTAQESLAADRDPSMLCAHPPHANLVQLLSTCLSSTTCLEFHTSSAQTLASLCVRKQGTSKSKPSLERAQHQFVAAPNPLHSICLPCEPPLCYCHTDLRPGSLERRGWGAGLGALSSCLAQVLWGCDGLLARVLKEQNR